MSHIPVLSKETILNLALNSKDIVLDGTVGDGGHAKRICEKLDRRAKFIGLDLDADAIRQTKIVLSKCDTEIILRTENFRNLDKVLDELGIQKVNKILFDLGTRMDQIKESDRGFSFKQDEPLVMTFKIDPGASDITAHQIINDWEQNDIANVLYGYGEEKFARRIAAKIVERRKKQPIETTLSLVTVLDEALPDRYKRGKTHFATKTFQALRIAVNDEIGALKEGLEKGFDRLEKEGRFVVISFHSVEDRVVKRFFREKYSQKQAKRLIKKPIVPRQEEIRQNPSSRSAKLRVTEKI